MQKKVVSSVVVKMLKCNYIYNFLSRCSGIPLYSMPVYETFLDETLFNG